MNKTPAYSFNNTGIKILKGIGIAFLGALVTYMQTSFLELDFGTVTPLIVSINSILVNILKEYINERK